MMKKNKILRAAFSIIATLLMALVFSLTVKTDTYAKALDEILDYEIKADVNDDATVTLTYHIEWKVLDSHSEGPLSWVKVGVPNHHCSDITALTDNIDKIRYTSTDGSYVRIDLDKEYYEGAVITFEFSLVQDYIYQVN
ncbi:MAG: hypothetical protein IK123_10865, partial [Lachnospiraceae bacterium]|nr:hypothetical protein [Lachnospiraceae bacterium]